MRRDELEGYLAERLDVAGFDDEALNGLQVEGRPEVRRVALAVSACAEAFARAAEAGADALLVHHGLLWRKRPVEPLRGPARARLAILLRHDLNLFAYHLPLDAHPGLGNNAVAARALGLDDLEPFCEYHGRRIGWKGRLPAAVERTELIRRLETYYGHRALVVPGGPATVRSVGVVSGGAAWEAMQAAREGLDLYVTGEASEGVTYLCREAGVNFAALGHYATERVGITALGEELAARFGLETTFLELENEA